MSDENIKDYVQFLQTAPCLFMARFCHVLGHLWEKWGPSWVMYIYGTGEWRVNFIYIIKIVVAVQSNDWYSGPVCELRGSPIG